MGRHVHLPGNSLRSQDVHLQDRAISIGHSTQGLTSGRAAILLADAVVLSGYEPAFIPMVLRGQIRATTRENFFPSRVTNSRLKRVKILGW